MIKSIIAITSSIVLSAEVNGLNKVLKDITSRWNPEDPFNSEWQSELYEATKLIGDAETFTFGAIDEGDEERTKDKDVVYLTGD